jgi:hypothetical protein
MGFAAKRRKQISAFQGFGPPPSSDFRHLMFVFLGFSRGSTEFLNFRLPWPVKLLPVFHRPMPVKSAFVT